MAKIYRPQDHWLNIKAYLSAITATNISQSFYLQDGGKKSTGIDMEHNYATVTLQGTNACRYNCHSAGSLGWPFQMLK